MTTQLPTIDAVLADPATSDWLKTTLRSALIRDPVDAANEAVCLCALLERRAEEVLADAVARLGLSAQG